MAKKEKNFFRDEIDKTLFNTLAPIIALVVISLLPALWIGPGEVRVFAIVVLVIMACIFFGPVLVFGGWFIVLVAQSGASIYAIILLIAFCLYVDSLLTNFGLLGGLLALWFFRK